MSARRIAFMALILLLAPVSATEMEIEGTSLDVGDQIHVSLAVHELEADSSLTAVVLLGGINDTEPSEWYILHWGPNQTIGLAGHDPNQTLEVSWGDYNATFDRIGSGDYPCQFVAAKATTWDGGQTVVDAHPDGAEDLANAWGLRGDCHDELPMEPLTESKDSPLALPLVAVGLLGALLVRRRAT